MTAIPPQIAHRTAADWLRELGDVPLHRIRMIPTPGKATEADALRAQKNGTMCELVNGTLVEKVMGMPESFLASILISYLWPFVRTAQLGGVFAPDAQFRMEHGNLRLPDVSFTRRERLPNQLPQVGGWCPDLCVEILSPSNTIAEMQLKRQEYFTSGCHLVWEINPRTHTAIVYSSATDEGTATDTLDGGSVLPGFSLSLAALFAEFDAAMPDPVG